MVTVVLCLGSNKGNRLSAIRSMVRRLKKVLRAPFYFSRLMETEPVGVTGKQRWYLNLILAGRYEGSPQNLLKACHVIERNLGRVRKEHFEARTADIDIVFFGSRRIARRGLVVPHSRCTERKFCMRGLCDIERERRFPGKKDTVGDMYRRMPPAVKKQKIVFRGDWENMPTKECE
jgi:2-amino-4-hydroxy-6-hydroxymethyldihydropteridine diphosphokinase